MHGDNMEQVEIVEVGPRDGLQNIPQFVPTETKVALIKALIAAGFKRMEIGSFVSPKAIPQMRDMEQVVERLGPLNGVRGMVLVPNARGAARAIAAGVRDIEFVISMSDAHNQSNVRRATLDSIADLRATLNDIDPDRQMKLRIGLATSFHCPFAGIMDERQVLGTMEQIVSIRDGMELAISDTTGMAIPSHVKSLAGKAIKAFGRNATFCFHGHDTAGFGIGHSHVRWLCWRSWWLPICARRNRQYRQRRYGLSVCANGCKNRCRSRKVARRRRHCGRLTWCRHGESRAGDSERTPVWHTGITKLFQS